jgi:hypothetical protein
MASFESAHGLGFSATGHLDVSANNDAGEALWIPEPAAPNEAAEHGGSVPHELHPEAIAAAQARAKLIVEKFQNQRSVLMCATGSHQHNAAPAADRGGQSEAERRRLWLQREHQRLNAAVVKNLDYVVNQERARLNNLNAVVENVAAMEQIAVKSYQQRLERRRQRLLGTKLDQDNSGTDKTTKGKRGTSSKLPRCSNAALYISGLGEESDHEELLRSLFGAFGRLQRIHFYRDKATNVRKGDGLVVYALTDDPGRSHILLQNVCGQVSTQTFEQVRKSKQTTSSNSGFDLVNEQCLTGVSFVNS